MKAHHFVHIPTFFLSVLSEHFCQYLLKWLAMTALTATNEMLIQCTTWIAHPILTTDHWQSSWEIPATLWCIAGKEFPFFIIWIESDGFFACSVLQGKPKAVCNDTLYFSVHIFVWSIDSVLFAIKHNVLIRLKYPTQSQLGGTFIVLKASS